MFSLVKEVPQLKKQKPKSSTKLVQFPHVSDETPGAMGIFPKRHSWFMVVQGRSRCLESLYLAAYPLLHQGLLWESEETCLVLFCLKTHTIKFAFNFRESQRSLKLISWPCFSSEYFSLNCWSAFPFAFVGGFFLKKKYFVVSNTWWLVHSQPFPLLDYGDNCGWGDALLSVLLPTCWRQSLLAGCKMNNVNVVYTPWSNLKKTADMDVGQIGFHRQKDVSVNITGGGSALALSGCLSLLLRTQCDVSFLKGIKLGY